MPLFGEVVPAPNRHASVLPRKRVARAERRNAGIAGRQARAMTRAPSALDQGSRFGLAEPRRLRSLRRTGRVFSALLPVWPISAKSSVDLAFERRESGMSFERRLSGARRQSPVRARFLKNLADRAKTREEAKIAAAQTEYSLLSRL